MLSCINSGEGCIKLWSSFVPFRTSGISGLLSPSTSWQVQFREVDHFGPRLLFCLPSWSLNSWLLLTLVVQSLEALQRVKQPRLMAKREIKDESRAVNALPKCLQSHSEEQDNKVVPVHRVHCGLCCAIALYLTAAPSEESRDFGPRKVSWLLCRAQSCSCRASFCHPPARAEFLRTPSAAYLPHFRGDELLLIALFKWAKRTRRSPRKLWVRLRQVVVIHHHMSVISY